MLPEWISTNNHANTSVREKERIQEFQVSAPQIHLK